MDSIKEFALDIANIIDDKKGENITVLDVKGLTTYSDYFIIATGRSEKHASSLAENMIHIIEQKGGPLPTYKDGHRTGDWVVVDYLDVVVHIFIKEKREFYNIERIWNDAKKLELNIDTY